MNQITQKKTLNLNSPLEVVIDEFDRNKIDWTLNQFEESFLNRAKKGKVKPFFVNHIQVLKNTGHINYPQNDMLIHVIFFCQ